MVFCNCGGNVNKEKKYFHTQNKWKDNGWLKNILNSNNFLRRKYILNNQSFKPKFDVKMRVGSFWIVIEMCCTNEIVRVRWPKRNSCTIEWICDEGKLSPLTTFKKSERQTKNRSHSFKFSHLKWVSCCLINCTLTLSEMMVQKLH